jgi:hypothetical protein
MDIYKDYDSKGKRVSPETARQIRSQLNKNHNEHALNSTNTQDYQLKMELKQLMHELNKVKSKLN